MHKRVGLVPLWRSPLKYWGWILTASDFKATVEVVVAVEAAKMGSTGSLNDEAEKSNEQN